MVCWSFTVPRAPQPTQAAGTRSLTGVSGISPVVDSRIHAIVVAQIGRK
jgi:hypothetical protein